MLKLLAMSLFAIPGVIVGVLFHRLTRNSNFPIQLCVVLGVIGSFAGIWLADIADLRFIGNVIDNLIFATVGSALLLTLNLLISRRS